MCFYGAFLIQRFVYTSFCVSGDPWTFLYVVSFSSHRSSAARSYPFFSPDCFTLQEFPFLFLISSSLCCICSCVTPVQHRLLCQRRWKCERVFVWRACHLDPSSIEALIPFFTLCVWTPAGLLTHVTECVQYVFVEIRRCGGFTELNER